MSQAPNNLALDPKRAVLLIIDVQERLVAAMDDEQVPVMERSIAILCELARRFDIPVVCSQQYPKGLGSTVPSVESALADLASGDRFELPLWKLTGVGTSVPAIAIVSQGFFAALVLIGVTVILAAAFYHYLWNRLGLAVGAGLTIILALGESTGVLLSIIQLVSYLLLAGLIILLVRTCGLDLVGFAVAIFWLVTADSALSLMEQPAADLWRSGALAVAIALVAGLIVLTGCRRINWVG